MIDPLDLDHFEDNIFARIKVLDRRLTDLERAALTTLQGEIAGISRFTGEVTFEDDIILDDGSGDSPAVRWVGGSNDDTVRMFLDNDATTGYSDLIIRLCDAAGGSGLIIQSSTLVNIFTFFSDGDVVVRDNVADAITLEDGGGTEYLKIITTNAQPIVRWNDAGVDMDFEIEAVGVADAFQVQGSDGQITLGMLTVGYVKADASGILSAVAEVALTDLDGYVQGSIIKGGAADWDTLAHPGAATRILQSTAAELEWDTTTDGQNASDVMRTDANSGIRPARLGVGAAVPDQDGVIALAETSDPTSTANQGRLYVKDDGAGNTELYYMDEAGGVERITPLSVAGAHAILSGTHNDAVAQICSRGSLIYGNSSAQWDELVVGTAHQILKVNVGGTDPAWASFDWDEISVAAGADMVHAHSSVAEGGQFDWDNVWSDAVHSHASGAEGGQLDWDTCWTDAVHDHSSDAEGGVLTVAAHVLLGAGHSDTTTDTVTRGSLIYGNATPAWDELVIGSAGTHLESNGTDVSWVTNITMINGAYIGQAAGPIVRFDDTNNYLEITGCKVGISTTTIPHGGVGLAMFALDGADRSTTGPHVQITTSVDNYPLLQFFAWKHDNVGLLFDAYYDGTLWRSSDPTSNFAVHKVADVLKLQYNGGTSQGSSFSWNDGLVLDTGGDVGIGVPSPIYRLDVADDVDSSWVASFFNDGNNANRYGIVIIGGANDGSGVTDYLTALDGDASPVGGVRNLNGTFGTYDASDEATKVAIRDTGLRGLDIVTLLRVRDYERKKDPGGPTLTGFVAQEVKPVIPAMVAPMPSGLLATSPGILIPILVKAVQELTIELRN